MKSREVIEIGKQYLLARVKNGLCLEFHQLRRGPSQAWTAACVGSTLAEFGIILPEMIEAILALWWKDCGAWSYNHNSLPDADTTLRVLQYFAKIGFRDRAIINAAERFIIAQQQADGGIATYLPATVAAMGYPEGGWNVSHPCVTALAIQVLPPGPVRDRAVEYMAERIASGDMRAYWWNTPYYVRYALGVMNGESISDDPVEIGLALLLKARHRIADKELLAKLIRLQLEDGSFPVSRQFRVPRPNQFLIDITEQVEVVEDRTRIFSTAAAVVAIARQMALLN